MSRTITVKGVGTISAKPDYVVLSMNVEAKDKNYDKAMDIAGNQLEELKDRIFSIGFEKDSLKTTNFNVNSDYKNYNDEKGNYHRVFNGFVCQHQLKLSFDFDMKRLSLALGTIANCLARPELHISFTVKDQTAVKEALLKEVTVNARKKAELLCEASNVKLGQLITINYNWSELNIYSDTGYDLADNCIMESPQMLKSIDIEPDNIDVRDTATFVWEIN